MFCLPLRRQSACVPQRAGFRLFAPPPPLSDDDICNISHPLSVLQQRPACHTMFTSGKTKRRAGACLTGGAAPAVLFSHYISIDIIFSFSASDCDVCFALIGQGHLQERQGRPHNQSGPSAEPDRHLHRHQQVRRRRQEHQRFLRYQNPIKAALSQTLFPIRYN